MCLNCLNRRAQAKEDCQGQLGDEDEDETHREEIMVQEEESSEGLVQGGQGY